jgi:hypothetical protein
MTSVIGHLTGAVFPSEYEADWFYPAPDTLFTAPVSVEVDNVSSLPVGFSSSLTFY